MHLMLEGIKNMKGGLSKGIIIELVFVTYHVLYPLSLPTI